jgi:DNA polymerase
MFVGEAPGANEDLQGLPFVGRSGQLLTQLLLDAGWSREAVYIANVIKCRPPGNRDPQPDEVAACKPFLFHQIETIKPKVITTLGRHAANLLLNCNDSMGRMRGRVIDFLGAKVVPTYHPSYILRGNHYALLDMRGDFSQATYLLFEEGIIPPEWAKGNSNG